MAIIPDECKFHVVSESVDTADRGSKLAQSKRKSITMADIVETIPSSPTIFTRGADSGGGGYCSVVAYNKGPSACDVNIVQGKYSTISGGHRNKERLVVGDATNLYGNTISGGENNNIQSWDTSYNYGGTIGGGAFNALCNPGYRVSYSTISGGLNSRINDSYYSTISGGGSNGISNESHKSSISGGYLNTIYNNSVYSTIGGGQFNYISAGGGHASIPGGTYNRVTNYKSHILGNDINSDRDCATFVNNLSIKSIPVSSAGLPSGSVWNNAGVLNIV